MKTYRVYTATNTFTTTIYDSQSYGFFTMITLNGWATEEISK